MRIPHYLILFQTILTTQAQGQSGTLDQDFNTADIGFASGEGPNGWISASAVQSDGRIIIVGSFDSFGETPLSTVARLNADGTLDQSFMVQPGHYLANSVAVQVDGKILIGGEFNWYNGTPCSGIIRLNSDGSMDETFSPGSPWPQFSYSLIDAITVQPDGKILIGGVFTTYNGIPRNGIARLEQDGIVDTTFDPGYGVAFSGGQSGRVNAIVLLGDGRIDIGGFFETYDDQPRGGVARVLADGTLDASFVPGSGAGGVTSLATLPDGGVVVAGMFTTFHGAPHRGVVQLNADGTVATNFNAGAGIAHSDFAQIRSVLRRSDGKLLIGGLFDSVAGQPRSNLALLEADGSLSATFPGSAGTSYEVLGLTLLADGRTLAVGTLGSASGIGRKGFALYNADGTLDTSFGSTSTGVNGPVRSLTMQADGSVMIAGWFGAYNGIGRRNIARITPNGLLDATFDANQPTDFYTSLVAAQPDGKTLVSGTTYILGRSVLQRLNMDGSEDQEFIPWDGLAPSNYPSYSAILVQPDGKILVAGSFLPIGNMAYNCLIRLNADGSLDGSFQGGDSYATVRSLAIQPDGKILVGGSIETWNGPANNLIRLHPDGTRDMSFDPGTALLTDFGTGTQAVSLRPDGRILVGGNFNSAHGLHCLMPDGSLDLLFDIGSGFTFETYESYITSLMPQAGGRTIVTGRFDDFNGTPVNGIVRLNTDGSLDETFDPGTGPNDMITCAAMQPNGDVVIGGEFTGYDGIGRNRLARVRGDGFIGMDDRSSTSHSLRISPNPASDLIQIDLPDLRQVFTLELMNATGQLVQHITTTPGTTTHMLNVTAHPAGLYTVRCVVNGKRTSSRFIVHR